MSNQVPAKTVQYKGALYDLVEVPQPTIIYKGAAYRLVSADRLPEHVQKYLRERKRLPWQEAMDEMLKDIEHVNPHRTVSYDPSKVRMRSDEEQRQYEDLKTKMTEMEPQRPRGEEEAPESFEGPDFDPDEFEEAIALQEDEGVPGPQREETKEDRPKVQGPSQEKDIHLRVSKNDLAFLSSIPALKSNPATSSLLNSAYRGVEHMRNEIWVSEHQLNEVITALESLINAGDDIGGEAQTMAEDLVSRYKQLVTVPRAPRKAPTYKDIPRSPGNVRLFHYRGATVDLRWWEPGKATLKRRARR